MKSAGRFSLRFYVKGDDFLRDNLRVFCKWISNRFPDSGKVVLSVSGAKKVKSWTAKRESYSISWLPEDLSEPAYLRLSAGIERFYHADSPRRRADYYVWVALRLVVEYRIWWLRKRSSETVMRRTTTRLMNEWVDYIDNGAASREERAARKGFFAACESGKRSAAERFLQAGANPNFCYKDCSPLGAAVKNGDLRLARILIASGAEINFFYSDWTAVHAAAAFGRPKILEYLLAGGGDANLRDLTYEGKTPMEYARENKQNAAIRVLRRFGGTSGDAT